MNQTQRLVSEICGYDGTDETGAKNSFYYDDCHTPKQKIECIQEFILQIEGYDMHCNIGQAFDFLDKESGLTQNERFHAFKEIQDLI